MNSEPRFLHLGNKKVHQIHWRSTKRSLRLHFSQESREACISHLHNHDGRESGRCSQEGLKECSEIRHWNSAPQGSAGSPAPATPVKTEGVGMRQSPAPQTPSPAAGEGALLPSPHPERPPALMPSDRPLPSSTASPGTVRVQPPSPRAHQGSGAMVQSPPTPRTLPARNS